MTKHDRKWAGVFIFFGMFVVFLSAVVEIWVTTSVIRGEKMWVLSLRELRTTVGSMDFTDLSPKSAANVFFWVAFPFPKKKKSFENRVK